MSDPKPRFAEFAEPEEQDIPTTEVDSAVIYSYAYSASRQVLTVVFKSTMDEWQYVGVKPEIAREMHNAKSKGSYFANRIRRDYQGAVTRLGKVAK